MIPHHLTLKQCGNVFVIGKAKTLPNQLQQIADHNTLGRVPFQDVFADEPNYSKTISREVAN